MERMNRFIYLIQIIPQRKKDLERLEAIGNETAAKLVKSDLERLELEHQRLRRKLSAEVAREIRHGMRTNYLD